MIYSRQDFMELELMTDEQVQAKIVQATQDLDSVQAYFKQMEDEQKEICAFESCMPRLEILFSQITNIEGFIRKAENLLNGYDNNRYINKSIKNRQANISSTKKSMVKKKIKIISL